MGVYVEKKSLSDELHDDVVMDHDEDYVMELVVTKTSPVTPRMPTTAWNAHVDPKAVDARAVEHISITRETRWTPLEKNMKSRYCRSIPFSRKRRLADAMERPTKHLRLSYEATSGQEIVHGRKESGSKPEVDVSPKLASPRTLHFALPGLSSHETLQLLGELVSGRHELSWLNSSRPVDSPVIPVFGWRSAVWSISTPQGNEAIVYKSAKAFEGVGMHDVARQMWMWHGSKAFPELGAPELVYAVSKEIRIVRQQDCLHGRAPHTSLWLEYIQIQKESIFLVRKELHGFQDSITGPRYSCERECHGYILHPLLVPMGSQVVGGTALHQLGSLRTRGLSAPDQIARIVSDMPRHVLQWEDCILHATSRV